MTSQSQAVRFEGEVTMKDLTLSITDVVDATMKDLTPSITYVVDATMNSLTQKSDDGHNRPQYPNYSNYSEEYNKPRNYDREQQQRDCSMESQDSVDDGYNRKYLDASPNSRIVQMGSPEPDIFQNNLAHTVISRSSKFDHREKEQEHQRQ
jgi:hypothetical protein